MENSGCCTSHLSDLRWPGDCTRIETRFDQAAHALRGGLRASGYGMAMGVSPGHQRISLQDDVRQFRSLRQISALHLQLQRRQSLSADERVLPGRFRARKEVCE